MRIASMIFDISDGFIEIQETASCILSNNAQLENFLQKHWIGKRIWPVTLYARKGIVGIIHLTCPDPNQLFYRIACPRLNEQMKLSLVYSMLQEVRLEILGAEAIISTARGNIVLALEPEFSELDPSKETDIWLPEKGEPGWVILKQNKVQDMSLGDYAWMTPVSAFFITYI